MASASPSKPCGATAAPPTAGSSKKPKPPRLECERVARVLDVGRTDAGAPFIVMEYLNGKDLARHLDDVGKLPISTAVDYVMQACDALSEAHALGIIRRDIKPSNVFLARRRDGSEVIKVLDFGISKVLRPFGDTTATRAPGRRDGASPLEMSMTGATAVLGSAAYMSPEQLHQTKFVDERTDVWALGILLYERMTGTRPFDGETPAAVGARIAVADAPRLFAVLAGVPEGLDAVPLRCLEMRVDDRFPHRAGRPRGEGRRRSNQEMHRLATGFPREGEEDYELRDGPGGSCRFRPDESLSPCSPRKAFSHGTFPFRPLRGRTLLVWVVHLEFRLQPTRRLHHGHS